MGDKQKLSAEGTTKKAQKSLKHPVFFRILAIDALLRFLNYTKNCQKHTVFTLQTKKMSLSCFDDKQYVLLNGVGALPFGHYSLREDAMFRDVCGDIEWGNDVLREKRQKDDEDLHPNEANDSELPIFSPPHRELLQNPITVDNFFDLIDLLESSDTEFDPPSTEPNLFLDMEASEVFSNCPPP